MNNDRNTPSSKEKRTKKKNRRKNLSLSPLPFSQASRARGATQFRQTQRSLDKKSSRASMASSSHHPPLSRKGRGGASERHPSAIAAFSVEAYSTLEAESHAHLAAVAAAASRRRRDHDECDEGNDGDKEETAAAAATEVRQKRERRSCRTFHSHSISAPGLSLSTSFVGKKNSKLQKTDPTPRSASRRRPQRGRRLPFAPSNRRLAARPLRRSLRRCCFPFFFFSVP